MLNLLLVIQIIICVALVGVILLQRSEGGALGMGGGTGGLMTARGAGNLLTRTTAILATLFFLVSGGLTIAGNIQRGRASVVDREDIRVDPNTLRPGAQPAGPPPAADVAPGTPGAPAAPAPSLSDLAAPLPDAGTAPAQPAPAEPAPGAAK